MDQAGYTLTQDDYREMTVASFRRRAPLRVPIVMGALLTGFNLSGSYCQCGYLTPREVISQAAIGFAIALVSWGAILLLNLSSAKLSFKSIAHLKSASILNWDDKGIGFTSKMSNGFYPWSVARSWMETRSLLVIYLAATVPFMVAKRAFDASEIEDMKAHLRTSGVKEIRPRLF